MSLSDIDTRPRRAICFTPMETDRRLIVDAAVRADRLGYDAVIVPEGWVFDSGVVLTEIAVRTERIRLVAGVQPIWGRTAAQLAMEAATLAEVSDGRFTLGLGASTPELASGLHGVRFDRPATRLADTVRTVRALLAGERAVPPDGGRGLRLGIRTSHDVPIWVAGLGPRTIDLAVREADAWFPAFVTASGLADVRDRVTPDGGTDSELVVCPAAAVSNDTGVATEIARQLLGWYLTGMGRIYGDRLAELGHAREVAVLRLANPEPRPGRISWPTEADGLLGELAVFGDGDAVARQLARWDALADLVAVTLTPGLGESLFEVIDAASPGAATTTAASVTTVAG